MAPAPLALHELEGDHHQVRGAVAPGCHQLEHNPPSALFRSRQLASAVRFM